LKGRVALAVVPRLTSLLIRGLHATMSVRHVDAHHIDSLNRQGQRYVLAFWHGQLLMMIKSKLTVPITAMISQHRDGELIARTLERFGVSAARGSTTRGGTAALREMIKISSSGVNLAFTPDGPKGPARKAQVGVVLAAQATRLPVMPVAFTAKKKRLMNSWDRFQLPRPFTRAIYLYGEPINIPRNLSSEEVEQWRQHVENVLNELTGRVEEEFDALFARGEK
jgi:lysophospholipid acyltransferase (LPLAT)-like uncharacterized protein